MIIEDLIRLGRPLLGGALTPEEVMELISDVGDEEVRNFYRHVYVVELPPAGSGGEPVAVPMQVWGQDMEEVEGKRKRTVFRPDEKRALAAPFVLPAGGNRLLPQGRYGVPVYPCWDPHLRGFAESAEQVRLFLNGRIARTPGFSADADLLGAIAAAVNAQAAAMAVNPRDKALGLLILARTGADGEYAYSNTRDEHAIGESRLFPGRWIVPRFDRILNAAWAAKLEEGAEKGSRAGTCSVCGQGEQVVSTYCKAWAWAPVTWNCPLPQGGKKKMLVEGVALDEPCYRALTLGACALGKLSRTLHPLVLGEVFAPAADGTVPRRKLSDLRPTQVIKGAAYLLPLTDSALSDPDTSQEFADGVMAMLQQPEAQGGLLDRYISDVTGFDSFLPPELDRGDYRLNLVYFSGDATRCYIHLRAFIQDVIPSTLMALREMGRATQSAALALVQRIKPEATEGQKAYWGRVSRSVPWLLVRAYGGGYLWGQLEAALHRAPLDGRRPLRNAARRMASLAHGLPDTLRGLQNEVIFHLAFSDFLTRYDAQIARERRENTMMRPWKDLLHAVQGDPVEALQFDTAADLGFACGVLTRQFGVWYWNATKTGTKGKDFLKHRVLTFGTDLSPETLWRRGLSRMFDVEARYEKLHMTDDFRQRLGVVLAEFERLREQVRADRDAFMAAFWSGYALQGYGRPAAGSPQVIGRS